MVSAVFYVALESHKADAILYGISIARLDADIDSLFSNDIVIATSVKLT